MTFIEVYNTVYELLYNSLAWINPSQGRVCHMNYMNYLTIQPNACNLYNREEYAFTVFGTFKPVMVAGRSHIYFMDWTSVSSLCRFSLSFMSPWRSDRVCTREDATTFISLENLICCCIKLSWLISKLCSPTMLRVSIGQMWKHMGRGASADKSNMVV